MTILAKLSLIIGIIFMLLSFPLIAIPEKARKFLSGIPRNKFIGYILTAISLTWAAYLLDQTPLGKFDVIKDYLMILTPVAIGLVIYFMDELLAARALGGLLILIPTPMLVAARTSDSPFRLLVVVLAYILVIAGIIIILNPYKLRNLINKIFTKDTSTRFIGIVGDAIGTVFIVLSLTIY
jgi:uncharacterized protein YjeT (DUF2065 family)